VHVYSLAASVTFKQKQTNANDIVTVCSCNDKFCAQHSLSDALNAMVTADVPSPTFPSSAGDTAILVAERRTKRNDVLSLTAHVQCRAFRQLLYVLHWQKSKTTASSVQLVVLAKD